MINFYFLAQRSIPVCTLHVANEIGLYSLGMQDVLLNLKNR